MTQTKVQVFCRRCGAIPRNKSECPDKAGPEHKWEVLKRPREVYCWHCKALPGEPSSCPSWYSQHQWVIRKPQRKP